MRFVHGCTLVIAILCALCRSVAAELPQETLAKALVVCRAASERFVNLAQTRSISASRRQISEVALIRIDLDMIPFLDDVAEPATDLVNAILEKCGQVESAPTRANAGELARSLQEARDLLRSGLPRLGEQPYLSAYSPLATESGSQEFLFSGRNLSHGAPRLQVGGKQCRMIRVADDEMRFRCEVRKGGSGSIEREAAELTLALDISSFFDEVMAKMLGNARYTTTSLPLLLAPSYAAKFTLGFERNSAVTVEEERTFPYELRNGHCQGTREASWQISPKEGESFVQGFQRMGEASIASGSWVRVESFSPDLIVLRASARNSGHCARLFGKLVSKDARGWVAGNFVYKVKRNQPQTVLTPIAEGPLSWSTKKSVKISRSEALVLRIEGYEGTVFESKGTWGTTPFGSVKMINDSLEIITVPFGEWLDVGRPLTPAAATR